MTKISFPDPFSDSIVAQIQELIEQEDLHDLTAALDAYINMHVIPEWYHTNSLSRIYEVLLQLRQSVSARVAREKVGVLIEHMKEKYEDKLLSD